MKEKSQFLKSSLWGKYDRYLILIGFIIISAVLSDKFFTATNINNLFKQNAAVGIVAIGELLVIMTGGIDLSVGAITSMSVVIVALFLQSGLSWPIAAILTMLIGLAAGTLNGFLITFGRMVPFVVTLATMSIYNGMGLLFSKGRQVFYDNANFETIGSLSFGFLPLMAVLWIIVAVICHHLLENTKTGRFIRGVGGNRDAARLSGVNVRFTEMLAYMISGLLSGIGGVLMAARLTLGSNSVGSGWELTAIASVMIGGGSSVGGVGTVGGVITGTIIMGLIGNIMNLLKISIYWQQIIKGIIILVAVYSSTLRELKKEKN